MAGADAAIQTKPVVLYDGSCGFCHRTVAWLVRRDREARLHYAPLQGEYAAELRCRIARIPEDLNTVVFVDEGRAYLRSRAFVRIGRYLPYPWRVLSWLWVIPWPIADIFYRLFARVRYRIFGRRDVCDLPAPGVRERFWE